MRKKPKATLRPKDKSGKPYVWIGREFTKKDNLRLPYDVRVLPSGDCYGIIHGQMRRLDVLKGKAGLTIALPIAAWDGAKAIEEVKVFIRRQDGLVLVGDEIERGEKTPEKSIAQRNSEALEEA